jgi:hypothetical protein
MGRSIYLPRRTLLGAAAASLALPFLEIFSPKFARAAGTANKRLIILTFPMGVYQQGTSWSYTDTLKPLADAGHQADVITFKGMVNSPGSNNGGGHTAGAAGILTCHHPDPNSTSPVNAVSMDQLVVQKWNSGPSLEIGTATNSENPNYEPTYKLDQYKDNYAWQDATTQKKKKIDPAQVFDQIYTGASTTSTTSAASTLKATTRKSILDAVQEDAKALQSRLGTSDKQRLDEYFTNVRSVEASIATQAAAPACSADFARSSAPSDVGDHYDLMMKLLVGANACDRNRVSTLSYEHTTTGRAPSSLKLGNVYFHDDISHYATDSARVPKYKSYNKWCVQRFSDLLTVLKKTPDPSGVGFLFDNSIVMFTSEISDGERHSPTVADTVPFGQPFLISGKGGGTIPKGGFEVPGGKTSELYINLLNKLDVPTTKFGDDGTKALAGF